MRLALGLMSGTSADGVDAALIRTDGEQRIEFVAALTLPYDPTLRAKLLHAAEHDLPLWDLLRMERELTEAHVAAVTLVCHSAGIPRTAVDLIGFHGHTIRHSSGARMTWQLGDISWLAERSGRSVVGDFRRRDIAAGGEGAPLAPLYHAAILADQPPPLAVLNLGGVANITYIGGNGETIAGDVGPGCGLIDAYCQERLGLAFDPEGMRGSNGTPSPVRVAQFFTQPFFARPLPKSADRFEFIAPDLSGLDDADALATLCRITAQGVASAFRQFAAPPRLLVVSGGGVHNRTLMRNLESLCVGTEVRSAEQIGLRPDSMEAECFAWLAVRRLRGLPLSLPGTTGCVRGTCGGLLTI